MNGTDIKTFSPPSPFDRAMHDLAAVHRGEIAVLNRTTEAQADTIRAQREEIDRLQAELRGR